MKLRKIKSDLNKLIKKGEKLYLALVIKNTPDLRKRYQEGNGTSLIKKLPDFSEDYQEWYSESVVLIKQLLPSRVDDFIDYYRPRYKRRKEDITYENYTISDCLYGLSVTKGVDWNKQEIAGPSAAIPKFKQQLEIVKSLNKRFESTLFDIGKIVQADLFDNELEAAEELGNKGFFRGAGAIAGVVLEGHLKSVCKNHNITIRKKRPKISDYNQLLKDNKVINVAEWRKIQYLADVRNLCNHKKNKKLTR